MDIITMRELGRRGRFGNALYQYAFVRVMAHEHNARYQVSPWVGQELFGLVDPPLSASLPVVGERSEGEPNYTQAIPLTGPEVLNHDVHCYAQYHGTWWQPRRWVWRLFEPIKEIRDRLLPAYAKLCAAGRTIVGFHIRRGDYGSTGPFYYTPLQWYADWLKQHWSALDEPVLFIASEDRELVAKFQQYSPHTAESLGLNLCSRMRVYNYLAEDVERGLPHLLDFYPDFWLLSQCDILVTGNSTFSFAAAMCRHAPPLFYRSHLWAARMIEEQVWKAYPLLHERLEDFPHIRGLKRGDPEADECRW